MIRILPPNGPHPSTNITIATVPDNPKDELQTDSNVVTIEEDMLQPAEEHNFDQYNIIRSDSVTVSEWGLDHTLKLRDEGKPEDEPPLEEMFKRTTPPTRIEIMNTAENVEGSEELHLPSTPVIHSKPSHETDWWSNALAESRGMVDDYDSLIESFESKESSTIMEKKVRQYYNKF